MLPFPPKNILVPTDLSEPSFYAWDQALDLAKKFNATIEIVYVQDNPNDFKRTEKAYSLIREHAGEDALIHILEGNPVEAILRVPLVLPIDLIIMASHIEAGLKRWFLGSVAERVVRQSPIPVLTVRAPSRQIHSILVPVNFTEYSDATFLYSAKVAAAMNARLTVLYVSGHFVDASRQAGPLARLIERLPDRIRTACRPKTEVIEGRPERVIVAQAKEHDLVVMASQRKKFIADMVLGTTAEYVLRKSEVPVLTVSSDELSRRSMEQWARTVWAVNA